MKLNNLNELYTHLGIKESAIIKFREIEEDLNIDYIKNLFYVSEDDFFAYLEDNLKDKYLEYLYIFLNLALDLQDQYIESNIDLKIYFDTIDDIRIWVDNCVKETGEYGLKEIYWINEHLRMRIFRLGRLQFQKRESEEFVNWMKENNLGEYVKHDYFYFVHIPEGGKLSHDLVEDSYQQALNFFKDTDMIFAAESWILSDKLESLFGSESNLVKFKNDFIILAHEKNVNPIKRYLREGSKVMEKVIALENEGVMIGEGFGVCLKYVK